MIVLTDASRLFGNGYTVVQYAGEEKFHLIERGSSSLTPTQQNYAMNKIECMAAQWRYGGANSTSTDYRVSKYGRIKNHCRESLQKSYTNWKIPGL